MAISKERGFSMHKAFLLTVVTAAAVMVSGCALVGRHSKPVEDGKRVTVGLISFDAVSDGYPMIPFYTSFEQTK